MAGDALEEVSRQLQGASGYVAIFGMLPPGDPTSQRATLRKRFAALARLIHPDQAPAGSEKEAAEIFRILNERRRAAEAAIEAGSYHVPFAAGAGPAPGVDDDAIVLRSAESSYRLDRDPFRFGDFSALYRGTNANLTPVIAKVSTAPAYNGWVERDAAILNRFARAKAGQTIAAVKPFVPEIMDTFLVPGAHNTRYRVNIMRFVPDFVSVAQIIDAHPGGLDPRDAAWIFRRVLAQTLAAAMAGVVHGAIVPDHILVDPFKHEPLHIGWGHALESGRDGRITQVIDRYRDFYPPEVFDKKPVDHTADLYMAGKTMLRLLGGNVKRNTLPLTVPSEVGRVILRTTEASPGRRPRDGKAVLDEFTRVVTALWGRSYRPLSMPVM